MEDADRFRLLGKYHTPRVRYGRTVRCEVRGEVEVVGLTDGPIPWPVGKKGRAKSLVVFRDLAKAIRRESELAVAHWWGVDPQTVWKWRKALGVGATTQGTSRLRSAYTEEPWAVEAWAKRHGGVREAQRREKIAASKRGKPRPAHVMEPAHAARRGLHHSQELCRRMSEAHKERGTWPPAAGRPWTPEEDALLGTMPDDEVGRRTNRTPGAVKCRRVALDIDGFYRKRRRKSSG